MRVSRAEGFIGDTWQINILALSCPLKPGRSKTYNDLNSRTSLFYQVSYYLTRVITRITRKVRTGEGKLLFCFPAKSFFKRSSKKYVVPSTYVHCLFPLKTGINNTYCMFVTYETYLNSKQNNHFFYICFSV